MSSLKEASELEVPLTPGNTIDSAQFSDTEPKPKIGRMKSWMM